MARRQATAPNEEWVLMYRGGLPGRRIAALFGVPVSTVGYHLRLARAVDPELRQAHEEAAKAKDTQVTARGLEQMQQLVTMVREKGRYPSRNAESTAERTLAAWLQRRREDARAGTLALAFREGLSVLPGWEGKPRVEADEERWHQRLEQLKEYRAAGNDWPRHKAGPDNPYQRSAMSWRAASMILSGFCIMLAGMRPSRYPLGEASHRSRCGSVQ